MHDNTEWFQIKSGEHEGRWHLRGWMMSAIPTTEGWLAVAHCPRCYAMIMSDKGNAYGDLTWNHEQWHAQTDLPIPSKIAKLMSNDGVSAVPDFENPDLPGMWEQSDFIGGETDRT